MVVGTTLLALLEVQAAVAEPVILTVVEVVLILVKEVLDKDSQAVRELDLILLVITVTGVEVVAGPEAKVEMLQIQEQYIIKTVMVVPARPQTSLGILCILVVVVVVAHTTVVA